MNATSERRRGARRAGPWNTWRAGALALALVFVPAATAGQATLPAPPAFEVRPIQPPPWYRAAVERGTRTAEGRPGPSYWQNRARYELDARLDPASARVDGRVRIAYENRSPVALDELVLHLHQNLFAPGVMRNEPQEVTGGVELGEVRIGDRPAREATGPGVEEPFFAVDGTLLRIALADEVPAGGEIELEIAFAQTLPQNGTGRMGWSEREMYFVAYWFPKMAVFDDLRGWDAEPFLGRAEFYDPFDDYAAALTVPAGWTVMATGELANADEVLSPRTRERLSVAGRSDSVVTIATVEELRAGGVTAEPAGGGGELTWRFRAESVRDFAFTASNVQQWDATSATVADRDGDGAEDRVLIHAFWRPERAPLWARQARWGRQSVEHHSRYTDLPYPWPHMTSVEGADIIGGGMEFPMLTIIGPYAGPGQTDEDLFAVTSHEIAHMWIPMIVGSNEKRYAWLDEGSSTFLEDVSRRELFPAAGDPLVAERASWLQVARLGLDEPLMRHGDWYETSLAYGTASYPKPADLLATLRGLLGEEPFVEAFRSFVAEWAWRLPTPWDLFATFERTAGEELDWFWRAFYYETWTIDHAVVGVEQDAGAAVVVLRDLGTAPAPAFLRIETSAGGTLERRVSMDAWRDGEARVRLEPSVGTVTAVVIDPDALLPDIDRSNNRWSGS